MFLRCRWLVPELVATFSAYPDLGLLSLSRGLNCYPVDDPIDTWEDLVDWRRLESTIGSRPLNWFRLQEVDAVLRPWVVRRASLETVGLLDERFVPTEWDEADLATWTSQVIANNHRAGAFFTGDCKPENLPVLSLSLIHI